MQFFSLPPPVSTEMNEDGLRVAAMPLISSSLSLSLSSLHEAREVYILVS